MHKQTEDFSSNIARGLESLLDPNEPTVTTLANTAAYLYTSLERINWVGFYLYDGEKLVLGPFGGKPACTSIPLDKGVCGLSARERKVVNVPDVHTFPGHIVCDEASRSELVLPIVNDNGTLFGVLDIDSPVVSRFTEDDEAVLEEVVRIVGRAVRFSSRLAHQ